MISNGYRLWLAALLSLSLLLSACGQAVQPAPTTPAPGAQTPAVSVPAPVTPINLRAADPSPVGYFFAKRFIEWMDRVKAETNGQVTFEYFPAEQLGKRKDLFDYVRQGTVDIAYVVPVDFPSQLPISTSVELPGFTSNTECGSVVYWHLIRQFEQKEYLPNGVRPLLATYVTGYDVYSKKPVRTPADVKGMKIRSGGGVQDQTVKALGGIPVTLPAAEVYEALSRGTVDGALWPHVGVPSYKLHEVTKNATLGAPLGAAGLTYLFNESSWQKLPQNVRDIMTKAAEEIVMVTGKAQDQSFTTLVKDISSKGVTMAELSAAELQQWKDAVKGVNNTWIETVKKYNTDGAAVIKARDELAAKYCK